MVQERLGPSRPETRKNSEKVCQGLWPCDPDCPVQTPNRASGPKWGKNGREMDFGPTRKKGPKMAQKWEKLPFLTPFLPLFPGGAKIHFSAIFFPNYRAGGPIIWGLYRAIGIANSGLEALDVSNRAIRITDSRIASASHRAISARLRENFKGNN